MTVAQLIEELQKQAPHKPVYFLVEGSYEGEQHEVDSVVNEGSYVLLQPS